MLDLGQQPLVFSGAEVRLEPLGLEHVDALAACAAESREHYRWTQVPDGREDTLRYIECALQAREQGERYALAIRWRGRIVGTSSFYAYQPWTWPSGSRLQRTDRPDVLEVGYTWLAASAQRTRCNTETKLLMLSHAFEVWEVHRVSLRTDERNQRSRRAIARLGAHFEGIARADKPGVDGTVRNAAVFSIIASEWPGVREHLTALLSGAGG